MRVSLVRRSSHDANVFVNALSSLVPVLQDAGEFENKRGRQQQNWMWKMLHEELFTQFETHPRVRELLPRIEAQVRTRTTA